MNGIYHHLQNLNAARDNIAVYHNSSAGIRRADRKINMHMLSNDRLYTMAKPSVNMESIVRRLYDLNIEAVISLDLQGWDYPKFSNLLKSNGIQHICAHDLEITDFYEYKELPPEKIIRICKAIESYDKVMIHCNGGNGRSGVISCAKLLLEAGEGIFNSPTKAKDALLVESIFSDEKVETYQAVADVANLVREANIFALERAEDIETLNDFFVYLRQLHEHKIL